MTWTPIKRNWTLPDFVRAAIQQLTEAGHVAYVVGGSVRDFLLGRAIKDYDIATDAKPDRILEIFPGALTVGKQFGVIKIAETGLEIASFRKDLEYKDHRRPTEVEFSNPEEDAKRRDFTINALFYDPKTQRVLDFADGLKDLDQKLVRTVGDPHKRFQEDALRLVRAARFSSDLDFKLDENTQKAMIFKSSLIKKISSERVYDELTKMWKGTHPSRGLKILSDTGLLQHILPESHAVVAEPEVWLHTIKVLTLLERDYPQRTALLSWAAVLIDIGKPLALKRSDHRSFAGHELDASRLVTVLGARLRFPGNEITSLSRLLADQIKFREVFQMRESTLVRWMRQPYFRELLALHHCDALATDGNLAYFEFCEKRLQEMESRPEIPKLIDGNDLIQIGFGPGPLFSRILETVEDLQIEGELKTKDEALHYVLKHYVQ